MVEIEVHLYGCWLLYFSSHTSSLLRSPFLSAFSLDFDELCFSSILIISSFFYFLLVSILNSSRQESFWTIQR